MAVGHTCGTVPVFQLRLETSCSFSKVMFPKYLIIWLVILSSPGAFLS